MWHPHTLTASCAVDRMNCNDGTRTRGLCRDSLWLRCNCMKIYGVDRQFGVLRNCWEVLLGLIAPSLVVNTDRT
jgi:hypothetical protein